MVETRNDGERFLYEVLGFIPQVSHKVFELRHMISRQFHNEGRGFAFERGRAHQKHAAYCDYDTQQIHAVRNYVRVACSGICDYRAGYCGKNRQLVFAHEKNGITRTVAVRSFSSASVRVFIIAGTEQPKPIIMGRNARPDKPNLR